MAKQRQSTASSDSSKNLLTTARGKVYLVGAGPGDAGLITWRGVECLRLADVVLYDYLVNPAILRHASRAGRIDLSGPTSGATVRKAVTIGFGTNRRSTRSL